MAEKRRSTSKRVEILQNWSDFLVKYMNLCNADEYDQETNPKGYVNLGTSVNNICNDLVYPRITSKDIWHCDTTLLQYREGHGIYRLRKALADLMTVFLETHEPVKADNLFCAVGVTSCLDVLAHCIADPGDVVLAPTPIYGRIYTDMKQRSLVEMWPIPIITKDNVESEPALSIEKVKAAYEDAKAQGKNVRGLVLINPNNPLGDIYTPELLMEILEFCHQNKIHAIVDEVYAQSVFPGGARFHSVLKFDELPDPLHTHVLYGISKDFAISGLRIGTIHTQNPELQKCLSELLFFQNIPFPIMDIAARYIKDLDWCKQFTIINQQRLGEKSAMCRERLTNMGLNVRKSDGGFFLWVDFRPVCGSSSFEQELHFFEYLIERAHLYMVPGKELFCAQPGWFRLSFTGSPDHVVEGLDRLEKAIADYKPKNDFNSENLEDSQFKDQKDETLEELILQLKRQIDESNWLSEQRSSEK